MTQSNEFSAFNDSCAQANVGMHAGIIEAGLKGKSDESFTLEPNGYYSAIAQTGTLLRRHPDLRLGARTIPEQVLVSVGTENQFPACILRKIINTSIQRGSIPARPSFTCKEAARKDHCFEAELEFANVIAGMNNTAAQVSGFPSYTVLTHKNKPWGIQKAAGELSSLTLVDICINGVYIPAGSIVQAEILGADAYNLSERRVFDVRAVDSIGFLRLSAFALNPPTRKKHFTKVINGASSDAIDVVSKLTLDQMRERVTQTLNDIRNAPRKAWWR